MSTNITLICERSACTAELPTPWPQMALAMLYGRAKGWHCTSVGDYCPDCTKGLDKLHDLADGVGNESIWED
jgi:hypothetical protein